MKIVQVESWRRAVPLSRPYTIATGSFDAVDLLFVRLRDDRGNLGLGSASPAEFVTGETADACEAALAVEALESLVGRDPRLDPRRHEHPGAPDASTPAARAAVDMALWDLQGQALGRPVVEILGRRHQGLPTSITLGISGVEESLDEAEEQVRRGFRHLKVKLGHDLELDLERLERLRRRYGREVALRVDVNQGYGPDEVERLFRVAGRLELELIEQPLARGDEDALADLAPLAARARAPLAADESLHDARDARRWAAPDSPYSVFNIKLMKCGGPSPAWTLAEIAEKGERDLMWGCMDESRISIAAALHVAYACRRTRYLDLDGSFDLARDPAADGFELREGRLYLGNAPGLGVRLTRPGDRAAR